MGRLSIAIITALICAACSSKAEQAEREFNILTQNNGSNAEKCAAATKVRDDYLAQSDSVKYREWQGQANAYCIMAKYS